MTTDAQHILHSFKLLSETDKRAVASEILRWSVIQESSPLTDDEVVALAEEVFLELDHAEESNG